MVDFMNPSDDVLVALGIGRDESAAELAERDARIAALEEENAALRAQLAAPLRLGRGPTVEEAEAHPGRWIVWLNLNNGTVANDGSGDEFVLEVGPDFVRRFPSNIRDAIPLSSSRQPCGVGVKP